MRLWLARASRGSKVGLIPTDDASETFLRQLGDGECAEFEVRRPRSLPMHRRYFGICRMIGQNQDPPRDEDSIDHELRILAGHYDSMRLRDPKSGVVFEVRTPKRIAFHKLTHDQWMSIWPSLEQAGIERFGETYWLEANAA
jgi:hypothetical protein